MGYTNYVEVVRPVSSEDALAVVKELNEFVPFLISVAKQNGIELINDSSAGRIAISAGENGVEDFHLVPQHLMSNCFKFCKTNRMPYDAAVVAMLLKLKQLMGDRVSVTSDDNDEGITDMMMAGIHMYSEASSAALVWTADKRVEYALICMLAR